MNPIPKDQTFMGSSGRDKFLFVSCFVALVATSFAFIIRVMLMDSWQAAFGLSETQKGEIFGAGLWPFGITIVLFSLVIDYVGYRRSMIFAFVCHVLSAIFLVTARGYWSLYIGSILNGLAAGTVEAVINPPIATLYPKNKTKMLTMLHAGWPGGFVIGGIVLLLMGQDVTWQIKAAVILVPVLAYGIMLIWSHFPVNERVAAGVPYRDMLKEAGAIGFLIAIYLVIMELNRTFGLGNIWESRGFSLPSLPMTILMAILVGGYLIYTGSLGKFMYIFLLFVMILLAITELGTDTWIAELMRPAMENVGLPSGLVLVYTATIMTILRFCIGPIVKVLKPLGVLLVSSLFAAAGLFFLSSAQGIGILVMATIYGTGQCFFWPVTLGLVAERFPRGGALTLNFIAGVGMLGVGIIGGPLLGYWQDTRIETSLREKGPEYVWLIQDEAKNSVLGPYRPLRENEVNILKSRVSLYESREEIQNQLKTQGRTPSPQELDLALAGDASFQALVNRTVHHVRVMQGDEAPPIENLETYAAQVAYLQSAGMFISSSEYGILSERKAALDTITVGAKQNAMATVAILPLIMALCYLGLILYFKSKGGYTVVELTEEGKVAGEHKPAPEEILRDTLETPNE